MNSQFATPDMVLPFFNRDLRRPGVLGQLAAGAMTRLRGWAALPKGGFALSELARLSDRELADIGLTRSEIPYACDRAFTDRRNADRALARCYITQRVV